MQRAVADLFCIGEKKWCELWTGVVVNVRGEIFSF